MSAPAELQSFRRAVPPVEQREQRRPTPVRFRWHCHRAIAVITLVIAATLAVRPRRPRADTGWQVPSGQAGWLAGSPRVVAISGVQRSPANPKRAAGSRPKPPLRCDVGGAATGR